MALVFDKSHSLTPFEGRLGLGDLDKLPALEQLCQETADQDSMSDLPRSRRDFVESSETIATVKSRLCHLGYYRSGDRSRVLNRDIRRAVREFQEDAGIQVDGWVGAESWGVLENLFSFEAESRIEHWVGVSSANRLLRRAVQLRLFAYGLTEISPKEQDAELDAGLKRFVAVAGALKLSDHALDPTLSQATLQVLFDQSETTRRLALLPKTKPLDRVPRKQVSIVETFLVCHAKIELWLLGHDVDPNGSASTGLRLGMTVRGGKRLRMLQNPKGFYWCLIAFCRDYNRSVEEGEKRITSRGFLKRFPTIFAALHKVHLEGAGANGEIPTGELNLQLERAAEEEPGLLDREWKAKSTLGGRIKDGLKRAWGWIKRVIRKAVGFVVGVVRNLIRLAVQIAGHGFGMVWAAIRSFPQAVTFFAQPEFEASSSRGLAMHHDKDFDWTIYLAPRPDQAQVESAFSLLGLRTTQFSFCLNLLKLLVVALSKVTKYLVAGYVGLMMALVRIRPYLEEFVGFYLAHKDWLLMRKRTWAAI